jgi:hypothetical protein
MFSELSNGQLLTEYKRLISNKIELLTEYKSLLSKQIDTEFDSQEYLIIGIMLNDIESELNSRGL